MAVEDKPSWPAVSDLKQTGDRAEAFRQPSVRPKAQAQKLTGRDQCELETGEPTQAFSFRREWVVDRLKRQSNDRLLGTPSRRGSEKL